LLLATNVWFKPQPSAEELKQYAQTFSQPRDWKGRVAPDFDMTLLDGAAFKLQDAVGQQVIVLNFFATWCKPCRDEMPELQRYQQANREKGIIVIGIDAEERPALVKAFVDELKIAFPVGIDETGDVFEKYDVTSFPTTIVIGVDGRVKLRETSAIMNAEVSLDPVVKPEIDALRAGRGIDTAEYLAALAAQPKLDAAKDEPAAVPNERAARIAAAMPCPCGCSDKVAACTCQTAKGIKARLAQGGYEQRSDAEVMEELNKEFCMKGM
jgi:thiol-disulfide isomerase/thioredoxin